MKILLFEWLTGGGLWLDNSSPDSVGNLLQQGSAMVSAVGLDLAKFAEIELLVDSRLNETFATDADDATLDRLIRIANVYSIDDERALKIKLKSLASDADAVLLIAPETNNCLANTIAWLADDQHKLVSPSLDFVLATSNKNRLADRLTEHGFDNLPPGMPLERFVKLTQTQQTGWLPIVVKPADGAGSEGIKFFTSLEAYQNWLSQLPANQQSNFRVEQFIAGIPASIAAVCQPSAQTVFFPAMKQILHPQPVGEYLRSEDSLSSAQQLRAKQLAARALTCLPETTGFVGFDIVISNSNDASQDMLIEINPRITMSYVILSEKFNDGRIAKRMLKLVSG